MVLTELRPSFTVVRTASPSACTLNRLTELFSWPNAQTAVMGAEQAALTMAIVMDAGMKRKNLPVDTESIEKTKSKIVENFEKQQSAFVTSAYLLDDGIIDPRDTRNVLGFCLSLVSEDRNLRPMQFGVARP